MRRVLRKHETLNRMDVLLMLLHSPGPTGRTNEPISGRTRLQKQLFLLQKRLREEGIRERYPYAFRPYKHGPFSKDLYKDVAWLEEKEELIRIKHEVLPDEGIYPIFQLTPKGTRKVEDMIQNPDLRDIYEIVKEIKQEYNRMNLTKLVELTHQRFREYHRPFLEDQT